MLLLVCHGGLGMPSFFEVFLEISPSLLQEFRINPLSRKDRQEPGPFPLRDLEAVERHTNLAEIPECELQRYAVRGAIVAFVNLRCCSKVSAPHEVLLQPFEEVRKLPVAVFPAVLQLQLLPDRVDLRVRHALDLVGSQDGLFSGADIKDCIHLIGLAIDFDPGLKLRLVKAPVRDHALNSPAGLIQLILRITFAHRESEDLREGAPFEVEIAFRSELVEEVAVPQPEGQMHPVVGPLRIHDDTGEKFGVVERLDGVLNGGARQRVPGLKASQLFAVGSGQGRVLLVVDGRDHGPERHGLLRRGRRRGFCGLSR